jgi:predicted ribosome quality control (RQC) complex YloA/Tae2 family protein
MKIEKLFIAPLKREVVFYIGKNKDENFEVINKGKPDDLWFHSKYDSSCHVVCEIPEDIQDKKQLSYIVKQGCLLCKTNTNKIKGLKNVEIIYTQIKNITKTDVIGCVITQNTKTIKI